MSQTNTNTNANNGQNWNQISDRGKRGRGAPNGNDRDDCPNGPGNNSIAKYVFEGKMKDGPISKLIITKTGHRPTQYKKIVDTPPILYVDKNFWGLDDVIWTENNLVEADFMLLYQDVLQWSTTHHVQISIVHLYDVPQANGSRSACFETIEQTHVFDANL